MKLQYAIEQIIRHMDRRDKEFTKEETHALFGLYVVLESGFNDKAKETARKLAAARKTAKDLAAARKTPKGS